jgi:hypothetical protein
MYCPVCFQDTLKLRSTGVVKISFDGKSRNTSLFTFNLNKDSQEDLDKKLIERIEDYLDWYAGFKNKNVITSFEAYSSDIQCSSGCKIDYINTKISVLGLIYKQENVLKLIASEADKRNISVEFIKK